MASVLRRTFSTLRALRTTMNSTDLPEIFQPPINRDMRELDRSFFRRTVPTSAATIFDAKQTSKIRSALQNSKELLHLQGIRPIVDDETEPGSKCILLRPEIKAEQPETWSPRLRELVEDKAVRVRPFNMTLTYDNWAMASILEAVLPELPEDQKETPAGFAQAGHIAHVNLRKQYHPYRNLIGQVLLDKNQSIRTVINKIEDVGSESQFRTFPYEILAGDKDLDVTASEQGCEFRFNFAEVYWNSRLGHEHERLVEKFKPGEAVCDAMAGVGPFAIPAGKRKVFVRANDLNPQSFAGLEWAIQRNKVSDFVSAACLDARAFIRGSTIDLAQSPRTFDLVPNIKIPRNAPLEIQEKVALQKLRGTITYHEPTAFDHYVMNLPASAAEFLDAFAGTYCGREEEFEPHTIRELPMIHVYTFQAKRDTMEEEKQEICEKISRYLGANITLADKDIEIHQARLVSPKKWYYCASFRLPAQVAFAETLVTKLRQGSRASSKSRSRPVSVDLAL